MTDTLVKMRSDLEIRAETSDPHSPVIVKDPIAFGFYRFTWVQAKVLLGLDGTRNTGAVAQAASRECQVEVTEKQVEEFIAKLQRLLLLDNHLSWSKLEMIKRRKHRLIASLLSVKIHAFNPDRFLARLDTVLSRYVFAADFHLLAAISIVAAVILSIANWNQLFLSLPRLFTLYSIPLILLVAFAVMTIHEIAHGLTLKHFGGRVDEMGFLFLYLIPAFYCNVSDAWLLRKRERMWVSLAGGYVQLILWAWATILWRLLAPETVLSRICLIAIAFCSIQALFNFNPLIRLDGYYLLSDYLEIPNLRQKAFAHLRRRLIAWLTGSVEPTIVTSKRERRIFVVFGFLASAFSAGLVLILLGRLGIWMAEEYRIWGVAVFAAICLMVVPVANKENAAAAAKPAAGIGARIRRTPHWLIVIIAILVGGLFPWELKVAGDFTILPNARVQINAQVEGMLKKINVDEGERVRKGDVLAETQNLQLNDSYEEIRGELAASRASLSLLKAGSRPEEIDRARRTVETREAELENAGRVEQELRMLQDTIAKREAELQNARATYERSDELYREGLLARNEMERDQTTFQVRQKELAEARGQLRVLEERTDNAKQLKKRELEEARSSLRILLAGSRKESIEEMAAQVAKLEQKLSLLGQQVEQLRIRSPIDGVIATPYLRNRIGEYIDKGDLFCEIVDSRSVIVDMPVPEKEIGDVALGYPLVLKVHTFPKRSFSAVVTSISPVAVESGQVRMVVIRSELDNSDGSLKAGMTGVGKIFCGKRLIADLATRRFIRWLRTEFWEYLP